MTTATPTNGHRRRLSLRKDSDDTTMWEAYPNDPPYDEVVEVLEVPAPPVADLNAADSGRPARPAMLPVLPAWARTAGGIRRNVRHAAPVLVNRAAHHGFRRGYVFRPVGWTVRGGWRLVHRLARFAVDADTLAMERDAARRKDGRARAYERKERHKTRQRRATWTSATLAAIALVLFLIWSPETPVLLRLVLAAGVLTVLVAHGVPAGDQDPTGDGQRSPADEDPARSLVSSVRVIQVLDAAGFKDVMTVGGVARRSSGPEGWEVLVDLKRGDRASAALKAAEAVASAFPVHEDRVTITKAGHAGQVRLTVFDEDPMAGPPTPHPTLAPRSRTPDLWNRGVLLGHDARGTQVRAGLVDVPAMLVAGRGGAGKTFLIFGIGAEVGAEPLWDSDCWSFKPSNDFEPLRPLCGTFRYGADQRTFDAFDRYLEDLIDEVADRNKTLGRLPVDQVPLAKVERVHAEDPDLRMRPRVVIVDEIQTALASRSGSSILEKLIEGGRIFRSQNVVPILGFQYVDRDTIEQLDRLLGTRVCLSVAAHYDSKGALGGAHTPEIADASKIPLTAKGVGYAAGVIEDRELGSLPAYKLRTFGIDRVQLDVHVKRCLAGPRAGQGPTVRLAKADDPARAKLTAAMGADRRLGLDVLAERLGHGQGNGALRKAAADWRAAGAEPRTETRDDGGVVARGAKYVDLDDLNG